MVFVKRLSRFVERADSEHREEGAAAAGKGNEGGVCLRLVSGRSKPSTEDPSVQRRITGTGHA
jgi:hypothetical protein